MLLLTSTSDLLNLTSSSTGTAALGSHMSFVDNNAGSITPGRKNLSITASTTTECSGQTTAAGIQRNVQSWLVRNNDSAAACNVTVAHSDGSVSATIFKVSLAVGETMEYLDGVGFRVIDSAGYQKITQNVLGRYITTTVLQSSANATHTVGAITSKILIRGVGGGGGSAGGVTAASAACVPGGGGAGTYGEKVFAVTPSAGYTYATGVSGTGGSTTGTAGGNGGNTTFTVGAVTVTLPGGSGGTTQDTTTAEAGSSGGAGGSSATNADWYINGEKGVNGWRRSGTLGWSGDGGDSMLGTGGRGKFAAGAGSSGNGYGSGAGGVAIINGSASSSGGTGGAGVWFVDEFS